MNTLPITPETRVAQLLDAYPGLEEVLVGMAPSLARLRNPVLRRTVARLTTLERAAGIADLDVRTVVSRLREAAGLEAASDATEAGTEAPSGSGGEPPSWRTGREPTVRINADALLDRGETPLPAMLAAAKALDADGLLEVTVAFRPLPLVDALEHHGLRTHIEAVDGGGFRLYAAR